MPVSLSDFEDAELSGMAAFERWRMEFEAGLIGPVADDMVAEVVRTLSPEQKDMLKDASPEAYKELMKRVRAR